MGSMSRLALCTASALLVASSLVLPRPASAGPFSLESLVEANLGCHFTTDPNTNECSDEDDPFDAGTRITNDFGDPISHSFTDAYLLSSLATAAADYGSLKVSASAEFDITGSTDTRFVAASAQTTESLSVLADDFTAGTPGFLDVYFSLSGTVSSTGAGGAGAGVGVFWNAADGEGDFLQFFFDTQLDTPIAVHIPIIAGQEFTLAYFLGALAGTPAVLCDPITPEPDCQIIPGDPNEQGFRYLEVSGTGTGSANFASTFELSGLIVTDAQGNIIQNPVFRSSSGVRYDENGVVPEPATLLLLGSGLAIGARRWRRR